MDFFKRSILLVVISILGIVFFWLSSRYPDLNAKSLMAGSATIVDTLSPWPIFPINENEPLVFKILLTTANWINSNLKGMAFGLFLGAAFLSLFSYITLPQKSGVLRNTFYGFILGTPLGVCVNCAAPVFRGILESKRIELALAAMLSSPTMNIVVLTMVFTLFPFYMGVVKILFTLICIFIGIPLISRLIGDTDFVDKNSRLMTLLSNSADKHCSVEVDESWFSAFAGVTKNFSSNLYFIAIRLIPLMLIAGLVGAILSLSLQTFIIDDNVNLSIIVLTSAFGILIPVPIAFDVILVNALYAQGLSEPIVLVLLCSLGIFSVFSLIVVWLSLSYRWAIALITFCFLMTIIVGLFANILHQKYYVEPKLKQYLVTSSADRLNSNKQANLSNDQARFKSREANIFSIVRQEANIIISSSPFNSERYSNNVGFQALEGFDIGLNEGFRYNVRDYTDPFWIGRGSASGDFNKDGWIDVIFGSNNGFILYKNIGGNFRKVEYSNDTLSAYQVFAVAFIDFDNDGWLDIFFTTFGHGNFVVYSNEGNFKFDKLYTVPNNKGLLTISPAFADIDQNGLLDVVNGNMALGVITGSHHLKKLRNNSIVFNGGDQFRDVSLETSSGETMSTLISDINNDGIPDIYFSNDFIVPDKILIGTGVGFVNANKNVLIEKSPFFSMSADSADINNDGNLDLLVTGTTITSSDMKDISIDSVLSGIYSKFKGNVQTCDGIRDDSYRKNCILVRASNYIDILDQKRNVNFEQCSNLNPEIKKQNCLLSVMWQMVTGNAKIEACEQYFSNDERLLLACNTLKQRSQRFNTLEFEKSILQHDQNFLNVFDSNSGKQKTITNYDHPGGWTWNSKIADFDNDGWQDVFNAEGAIRRSGFGWNTFMKNQQGINFEQKQFSLGLVSDFGLYSFTILDIENDGDLDIIGNAAEGPVQVYLNQSTGQNNQLAISLIDQHSNYFAIGAKIKISYGDDKIQIRELKASGGYMSFDAAIAYFGMADYREIESIIIVWPDRTQSVLKGPFNVSQHYRIERLKVVN